MSAAAGDRFRWFERQEHSSAASAQAGNKQKEVPRGPQIVVMYNG
jgi:hypothetical protein